MIDLSLSKGQWEVLMAIICKYDAECKEFAIDRMKNEDIILIKDVITFGGKIDDDYPTFKRNNSFYTIAPSAREKYNKLFGYYLEKVLSK